MADFTSERLVVTAVAFRGYNTTNLGRTPELLAHPDLGGVVRRWLSTAETIIADALGRPSELIARVEGNRESSLETFADDIGLILATELAQLELLRERFGIDSRRAPVATGYSLGEIAALVHGGVYELADVLIPLATLAGDCAELAHDATMGILFSRGPALDIEQVERLCLELNREGHGVIAISSILSPNTLLMLGQGDTIDRFKARAKDELPAGVNLRKNNDRWPPLHTPLLWQRSVVDRAAHMMQVMPRGETIPTPPVISHVTGKASYTATNSRHLLRRWLDEPQRLWDVVYDLLARGTEVMLHVGPDPNLLPATFKRLSDNVHAQMNATAWGRLGMQAMGGIARRPWLTRLMSSRVALLRAPFVEHVILEDWLLAHAGG